MSLITEEIICCLKSEVRVQSIYSLFRTSFLQRHAQFDFFAVWCCLEHDPLSKNIVGF